MLRLTVLTFLIALSQTLMAQDVINKSGNKCPTGYRDGKGAYCYANSEEKGVTVKEHGRCPRSYRNGPGKYWYP